MYALAVHKNVLPVVFIGSVHAYAQKSASLAMSLAFTGVNTTPALVSALSHAIGRPAISHVQKPCPVVTLVKDFAVKCVLGLVIFAIRINSIILS